MVVIDEWITVIDFWKMAKEDYNKQAYGGSD